MQNLIDGIIELYLSTLYKLRFLAWVRPTYHKHNMVKMKILFFKYRGDRSDERRGG
jgi:hypothetical protein